jgi:hypothetical protein
MYMRHLPEIETREQLCGLIEEIGFLTLFENNIPGMSVMDITKRKYWFEGDPENDPWEWREQIAAEGRIAYGKFFNNKMGFISKDMFPSFANFRRDGYDFDSFYEEGLAPRKSSLVMKLFEDGQILPSYDIRRLAGFGKNGEKGFEGALALLQMRTYLTVRGFARKRNKAGEEYGWATALYSAAEELFGFDYVRSEYRSDPEKSKEKIINRFLDKLAGLSVNEVLKLIN